MLIGTVVGVLVIPGLYYLFGKISDGRKLLRDEVEEPLTELVEHDESHEFSNGAPLAPSRVGSLQPELSPSTGNGNGKTTEMPETIDREREIPPPFVPYGP